jgi:hypothetical protein
MLMEITMQEKFDEEFKRLRKCDPEAPINIVIGVALENIADRYLRGNKKSEFYKNLIQF